MKKKYIPAVILLAVIGLGILYFSQRGEYVRGSAEFSREEIFRIFNDNEEKFDYIVTVLKKANLKNVYIRIKRTTKEAYIYDTVADTICPYTEFIPADSQFEAFLIDLLVVEKLGKIYINLNWDIDFGSNFPITYSQKGREVEDSPEPIRGRLKENWYYYIHIPV